MTENYGDWHERELADYGLEQRERDLEWEQEEAEQQQERLGRDQPVKTPRKVLK